MRETHDVVYAFSHVSWEAAQRRGMNFAQDRLAQALVNEPRVRRLLVADPFRSLPIRVIKDTARIARQNGSPFPKGATRNLVSPLRFRRRDPQTIAGIERTYRAYSDRLRRAAKQAGLVRPVVITPNLPTAAYAPFEWAGPVTFYATDDWCTPGPHRLDQWLSTYVEGYSRIRESGHAVCAVSGRIIEKLDPTGPWAVVPNGVEPAEWNQLDPAPEWYARLPRPRILYVGTLDRRLDVPRLLRVANAFSSGSVVLVGPVYDGGHLAPLLEAPNVHRHPRVSRLDVPPLVAGADVCVVPHARTPLTEAMSPLKLYEYIAGGRPVAAVDLPPMRGIDQRVVLCGENQDFAETVAAALELGPATETERRRFIDANSWRKRHERILELALGPVGPASPEAAARSLATHA